MSEKIIFLDIDGPMIPTTFYFVDKMASFKRIFPAQTIAAMNVLCERSGASIVFNTTHNISISDVDDIDVALVKQGLKREYIRSTDFKTDYPSLPRKEAVKVWLRRNQQTVDNWVAFDDVKFTDEPNLIYVDADSGITIQHINEALIRFDEKAIMIFI